MIRLTKSSHRSRVLDHRGGRQDYHLEMADQMHRSDEKKKRAERKRKQMENTKEAL